MYLSEVYFRDKYDKSYNKKNKINIPGRNIEFCISRAHVILTLFKKHFREHVLQIKITQILFILESVKFMATNTSHTNKKYCLIS